MERTCILIGADQSHGWMIPWWLKNFHKTLSTTPVILADFGLAAKENLDLSRFHRVLDLHSSTKAWFQKPAAIRACTEFDKVLFMDIDCEVMKPVEPLFRYCDENSIGVTWDDPNEFCRIYVQRPVATGVVVASPRNEMLAEWAWTCQNKHAQFRGDQEAFNSIIGRRLAARNMKTRLNIMPAEFQWLRLNGFNPDATIMHWTGVEGKKIIAEKIQNET